MDYENLKNLNERQYSEDIHPLAIVHPKAKIGKNVKIGPFCKIGPDVEIADNNELISHVLIEGHVSIGPHNIFYPFSTIGFPPQDTSYKNEPTKVEIGQNNTFREYVSIHRGTLKQDGLTKIGNHCFFMAYVHIGHDVTIHDHVILVNAVNLAGHVTIGKNVIVGGATNISQFVTLGRGSYIGGASAVDRDIPPFATAYGNRIRLKGINIIGMRRQGLSRSVIAEVVDFFKSLESSSLSPRAFVANDELMTEYSENEIIKELTEFVSKTEIGIAPFA